MKKLSLTVLVAISIAGCKKAADLAQYKDRATALAAKYAPKLGELSKKLPELASHAKDLPVNVPGADKLGKLLEDNKSELASAQDLLASLPAKIASESPEKAQKDLDAADKALSTEVAAAENDEKQEAAIEATTAPAGSGSGSAAKK